MRKVGGKQVDESIKFAYDKEKSIETTVGQLNFFKWAIENGVLAYIVDHLTDIVEDMILSSKQKKSKPNKKKSNKKIKHKNSPKTTVSATKTITNKQKIKVVVSFS
jgi:hypothetical protein